MVILSIKTTIEELANYLGEMKISGAGFFVKVDNKSKKIFSALTRVDVPADKDNNKVHGNLYHSIFMVLTSAWRILILYHGLQDTLGMLFLINNEY